MKSRSRLAGIALMAMLAVSCPLSPTALASPSAKKAVIANTKGGSGTKTQANDKDMPDFAFPQTVIDNAEVAIHKASASGNETEIIRSAIQIVMANNLISTDRMPAMALMLDSLAQESSPGGAAILYSLEAQLYQQVYRSERYRFDRRTLPLGSFPADPQQWSGQLFALKVMELTDKSLAAADSLRAMPSADWKGLLTDPTPHALQFYPTLYSILATRSLYMLDTFAGNGSVIPFGNTTQAADPEQMCSVRLHDIARDWYSSAVDSGNVAEISEAMGHTLENKPAEHRFSAYMAAYDRYKTSPYSTEFLIAAAHNLHEDGNGDNRRRLIAALEECVAAHPDYFRVNVARNTITALTAGSGMMSVANILSTDMPVKVSAITSRMPKGTYACLYKLPANTKNLDYHAIMQSPLTRFIASRQIAAGQEKADTCTLDFGKLPAGHYILAPCKSPDGARKSLYEDYAEFTVTDLVLSVVSDKDKRYVLVTGTTDGKPCNDMKVKFTRIRSGKTVTATTDADGLAPFPDNWNETSVECTVRRGDDVQTLSEWFSKNRETDKTIVQAHVLTDLGLYHPGDTCRFTAIAYERDGHGEMKRAPKADTRLRAILHNASYTPCDTLDLTSDRDGRASGSFILPKDGMNGTCTIHIFNLGAADGAADEEIGSAHVRIEQYRQPSFFVEIDDIPDIVPGDTLTVSGKAVTYSGMPLSGATVRLNFDTVAMWWYDNVNGSYSADSATDSDGRFSLALATGRLADTGFADQIYRVQATVTSEAGESQESGFQSFFIGSKPRIRYSGTDSMSGDKDKLTFPFTVIGGKGDSQSLGYQIRSHEGAVMLSGTSPTPVIEVSASEMPSGEYTIEAEVSGERCTAHITIFRNSDTVPPCPEALWAPETHVTAPEGASTVRIPVGSARPNYIFYMVSDKNGIVDKGFIRPQGKMERLQVKAPSTRDERTWVTLCTTDSCRDLRQTIEITPSAALDNVKVEKIAFRDKINAGGQERWTFRYTLAGKDLADIPVVATLSDKSLSAIYPFRWSPVTEPYIVNPAGLRSRTHNYMVPLHFEHRYAKTLKAPYLMTPDIYTYGNDLYNRYGGIHIRGARTSLQVRSAAMTNAAPPNAEPEALALDEVVAVGYGAQKKESLTGSMSVMDTAEEEMAHEDGGNGTGDAPKQPVKYRPAEMPLAWFKPALRTDSAGVLEISFTAPDFNTTWQLQMLGYDRDMLSNLTVADIVASKPVMVSTNSPRFLRTGDRVTLMSTVYNNTDRDTPISAHMEIYDPLTGSTLVARDFAAEQVDAAGSRVVALEFIAPADLEFVAYRVSGSADSFSDGEQSLIAIVPSSSPVTESWPFYMAPDSDTYSLPVPQLDKQAQVFFQYCDNPVWECVTALPDMTSATDASILSLADRMYGNAIAAGLVKRYPRLEQAIRTWSDTGDSTLVSKLQRDPGLKTMALDKTPWVLDAQVETLRMGNLANLLDTDNCEKTIAEAMKRLTSEQRGGGWSWCEGMEPSMFITGQVLWRLGMLSQMGCLPQGDGVRKMIESALHFCDKELYKDYVRADKHFSTTGMLDYLYIRSFFPSVSMGSDFATLKRKALTAVKEEWKGFGIYHKATAATLMAREKEPMLARTILESVSQLASRSAERGMWFDNLHGGIFTQGTLITTAQALEAFTEITPQAPAVDQLRQWLIIQRQAQDWGRDAQLAEVVYAVLSSGTDWTETYTPARLFLGDKELTPARRDRITGSFTMPLTAQEASGQTLRVVKNGAHQSWGGLLARYIAPVREIKEFSESDITVSKRILLVEQGKDGTSVRPLTGKETLRLGQRIRVQLTVTSSRDIDYAVITDERGGFMAPADQLSRHLWQDGVGFYREMRDESTNFFLPRLPKGDFILEYDCFAGQEGDFAIGIATLQSLYAPTLSAHSAGARLTIRKQ